MSRKTEDVNENPAPTAGQVFPKMLTLEQVQDVLNVKASLVYALVRSGELPAGQFGGRGYLARRSELMKFVPRNDWRRESWGAHGFCEVRRDGCASMCGVRGVTRSSR